MSLIYKNFISYNLVPLIVLNYLVLNTWLINLQANELVLSKNLILYSPPLWIILFFTNLFLIIISVVKKIKLNSNPTSFAVAFFVFQFFNIKNIDSNYFWNTIPDARTYKDLGTTLLECGKLALTCDGKPLLDWPPLQPFISGFLNNYFFSISKYIYLALFSLSFYIILKLTKESEGPSYLIGALYFFLMFNNYELSSFISSETPYIFFSITGLYYLKQKKINITFIFFILSFFVRPIGISNIIIFFLYLMIKKIKISKYLIIFTLLIGLTMSYNLIQNDNFVFSTTLSTNIEGDGLEKDLGTTAYLFSLFQPEYLQFFVDNLERLYGQGSRDCVFEHCFIYNPYFDTSGKVPGVLISSSIFSKTLNFFLKILFSIGSPIGIWVFLPVFYIFNNFMKNKINWVIFSIFILNIIFSILTSEYGSRWWLYINFLSIYLISSTYSTIIRKVKSFF